MQNQQAAMMHGDLAGVSCLGYLEQFLWNEQTAIEVKQRKESFRYCIISLFDYQR